MEIFTDFDGTVTTTDSLQLLLTAFSGDSWLEIESRVEANDILERDALQMEFDLIHATAREALEVIDRDVALDPTFNRLVAWSEKSDIPLTVVSGGFAGIIRRIILKYGLGHLEVLANDVIIEDREWTVVPSERERICDRCNHCKSASLVSASRRGERVVYIGNGLTDRCPAAHADILFAKGTLAAHCGDKGIPYHAFGSFDEVREILARELEKQ